MQITFERPGSIGPGVLVVGVNEGGALAAYAVRADEAAGGALQRAVTAAKFKGKAGQLLEVLAPAGLKASRVLLVGLGKGDAFDGGSAERLAAGVIGRLLTSGEERVSFAIDLPKGSKI
mgnify:CR=1 FL=1